MDNSERHYVLMFIMIVLAEMVVISAIFLAQINKSALFVIMICFYMYV